MGRSDVPTMVLPMLVPTRMLPMRVPTRMLSMLVPTMMLSMLAVTTVSGRAILLRPCRCNCLARARYLPVAVLFVSVMRLSAVALCAAPRTLGSCRCGRLGFGTGGPGTTSSGIGRSPE